MKTTELRSNRESLKKHTKMSKIKKEVIDTRPKFKLQIDGRTTITVRSEGALKAWMEKYPEAKLID